MPIYETIENNLGRVFHVDINLRYPVRSAARAELAVLSYTKNRTSSFNASMKCRDNGGLLASILSKFGAINQLFMAYLEVHSLATLMAACSSFFQSSATSFAKGSSGLGAPNKA